MRTLGPDDVDTFGSQKVGCLLHVVDFERDHAVPQMLGLRSRVDLCVFVCDQLDDCAAENQIHKIDGHTQTRVLDPVSGL